ncbi:MAG: hypothetical protein GC162_08640 [Planctomycetes bacterium]|nr:hypothetical protein [Planctomycetota bacterium]
MTLLDWLAKKMGRLSVPFTTETIIGGQIVFYGLARANPQTVADMALIWNQVLAGEWWRLVTFIFIPPIENPIFAIFTWYIFYLMGTALEGHWGTFRYNVFVLVAYLATVATALLVPMLPMANTYILLTVLLAFATLYPNFELMLMFFFPVRVKWIAMVTGLLIAYAIVAGDRVSQLAAGASVVNYLLFFSRDIFQRLRSGQRGMARRAAAFADKNKAFHECIICGKTDKSHPNEEFRYCPECDGAPCYCSEHIFSHTHIRKDERGGKGKARERY